MTSIKVTKTISFESRDQQSTWITHNIEATGPRGADLPSNPITNSPGPEQVRADASGSGDGCRLSISIQGGAEPASGNSVNSDASSKATLTDTLTIANATQGSATQTTEFEIQGSADGIGGQNSGRFSFTFNDAPIEVEIPPAGGKAVVTHTEPVNLTEPISIKLQIEDRLYFNGASGDGGSRSRSVEIRAITFKSVDASRLSGTSVKTDSGTHYPITFADQSEAVN